MSVWFIYILVQIVMDFVLWQLFVIYKYSINTTLYVKLAIYRKYYLPEVTLQKQAISLIAMCFGENGSWE